jgi:DtxR family transcriptional regulator, Mn-dependent transcriptional regulator
MTIEIVLIGTLLVVLFMLSARRVSGRWKQLRRITQREHLEDALKHLHHCEYEGRTASLASIAGALSIPLMEAGSLMERLNALRLVVIQGDDFHLTSSGRTYALRIIRVHRLWERYFADETGLEETAWHDQAEKLEHRTSPEQAEALASHMGHPPFDPHGDPIPNATGVFPPRAPGVPLSTLSAGATGRIVHIEDEPKPVFAQIVAQGLHPGLHVRVVESSRERVVIEGQGEESILAPLVAANVTVLPMKLVDGGTAAATLASLRVGDEGTVVAISGACRGRQRRRLMDLGIVPGTRIRAEMRSASGDPTAYLVRGAMIGLRESQAKLIHIQKTHVESV